MGLFDTVKLKANALAADAERAGKVTAAQARTVVLQNEIRKAERELGHSAFSLIESDEIAHPDLEAAAARLRDARQALKHKEAEIAGLRHGAEAGDEAAPAPAETAADTGADAPLSGPEAEAPSAAEPRIAEPAMETAPSAAAYCKNRGGTLEDDDAFCQSCGRPLATAPTAAT
jgi:putative hemolysin